MLENREIHTELGCADSGAGRSLGRCITWPSLARGGSQLGGMALHELWGPPVFGVLAAPNGCAAGFSVRPC
jgi:hypothetical protein